MDDDEMDDDENKTPAPRPSWHWVPRPVGISGLEEWCKWLNFIDAILTSRALTGGRHTELNLLMRSLWNVSPLLYGTAKFWLFWFGLKCLERATLHHRTREGLLHGLFVVFLSVFLWHLYVLSSPG